ncbi:MAG: peptidase S8 and S53 subtilisin kexin sedolisin [Candidatus Peregrinibacteria bacterium Gr01-1014_25]|nr:MAG: peptidase S8 and S53 subtilisin kexin sedolisin [Candidatus Peregrinibacteria bacterium Gr01-1014_25]
MERIESFAYRPSFLFTFLATLFTASVAILLILVATTGRAHAQARQTHYSDIEAGAWYEDAAAALLASGALDRSESRLRPGDLATRAEVMKMLVHLYGHTLISPSRPSFDDVPRTTWYYPYVETAARAGLIRGDKNCYEQFRPCTARPADGVNRAEMAILLGRAYALSYDATAPVFPDNRRNAWYFEPIQTAADHCILQGDDRTGNVRPAAFMNRAEMVAMFHRASQNLEYGIDCGDDIPAAAEIISVTTTTDRRIRVRFSADLDSSFANDAFRYALMRVGGNTIDVTDVASVDDRTVDLALGSAMSADVSYRLTVRDMETADGRVFADSITFVFPGMGVEISTITVREPDMVRVRFTADLDLGRADDAFRYLVRRDADGNVIDVDRAVIVDDRTVDLELARSLTGQMRYTLTAEKLRTDAGVEFTDSATLIMDEASPAMISVFALSPTRIQMTFNADLDEGRAEQSFRYRVSGNSRNLPIAFADRTSSRVVELTLNEALQAQREYLVIAADLLTEDGVQFSDDGTFLYAPSAVRFRVMLSGQWQVPAIIPSTSATGTGTFTLTASGLAYDITVRNLSGSLITAAHFHRGSLGTNGPVLEPINFNGGTRATGTWSGLTTDERDDLLNEDIYVNVHTQAHPDGEIRGQVEQE